MIDKTLKKDSMHVGSWYALSVLFVQDDYEFYHIDSAYSAILKSQIALDSASAKMLKQMAKIPLNDSLLWLQRDHIDSLAFNMALEENTEKGYQTYLDRHLESKLMDKAIELRNARAFETATNINTYEGYRHFFEKYPLALEAKIARERYESLLFQSKTKDRKLASYIQFLHENPNTPFIREAERAIYAIIAAQHSPGQYLIFLKKYPKAPQAVSALNRLFHLEGISPSAFAKKFAQIEIPKAWLDSLSSIDILNQEVLFPTYENGLYSLFNLAGKPSPIQKLPHLSENYFCGNIHSPWILQKPPQEKALIINRKGQVIAKGEFEELHHLPNSWMKVKENGKWSLWHVSGEKLSEATYDEILPGNKNSTIGIQNNKFLLLNGLGQPLFPRPYDEIRIEKDLVLVRNGKLWAILEPEDLTKSIDLVPLEITFQLEDYEWIGEDMLWIIAGKMESLMHSSGQVKIPLGNHKIEKVPNGWAQITAKESYFYPVSAKKNEREVLESLQWTSQWKLAKKGKWALIRSGDLSTASYQYDSASLLAAQAAILRAGDTLWLAYRDTLVRLDQPDFRMVRSAQATDRDEVFFVLNRERNRKVLLGPDGIFPLSVQFEDANWVSPGLLSYNRGNKKGLLNTKAETVGTPRYDAIGVAKDGWVSTLAGGKFGAVSDEKYETIPNEYDMALQLWSDKLLLANKKGKWGLIDEKNKTWLSFEFDQILPLENGQALTKKANQWQIRDILKDSVCYEQVLDWKELVNSKEEKILLIRSEEGYGLYSTIRGELLSPTYNDVINLGTADQPVFFAEKHVKEAEFYVVVYYNQKMEVIKTQAFQAKEYDNIFCY